jgi:hypothetical protein
VSFVVEVSLDSVSDSLGCRRFASQSDSDTDKHLTVQQLELFHSWFDDAEAAASGGTHALGYQSLSSQLLANQGVVTAFMHMLMYALMLMWHRG